MGADKSYDQKFFVQMARDLKVTPHVSRKAIKSAIDGRKTRHPGYGVSMKIRKRIEEGFGWLKTVGGLRKTKLIGREKLSAQLLLAFSVYNLIRLGACQVGGVGRMPRNRPKANICAGTGKTPAD